MERIGAGNLSNKKSTDTMKTKSSVPYMKRKKLLEAELQAAEE